MSNNNEHHCAATLLTMYHIMKILVGLIFLVVIVARHTIVGENLANPTQLVFTVRTQASHLKIWWGKFWAIA